MRYLLVALMAALLVGCATPPPSTRFVSEETPKPPIPTEPVYPVDSLPKGTKGSPMLKALTASLELARGHIKELRELLQQTETQNDNNKDRPAERR